MKREYNLLIGEQTAEELKIAIGSAYPLGENEMKKIAEFIAKAAFDFENSKDYINKSVAEICKQFPLYK